MPEAARITDQIGHVSIWARLARVALRVGSSLLEGLAIAAVITLAVGGSVLTMGCGAIIAGGLIAGFLGSATGYSAWKEKKISELTADIGSPDITGVLTLVGSSNVLINNLLAARAIADAAICSKHSGPPIPVAEGSDSIWVNTYPAARKGDKVACSAKITQGSANVFFGGKQTAYLEVADDKLWWETGLELVIGLAMMRGSFPGRIGCMGLGLIAGMVGDQLGTGFRSLIGYPVNPATGGKVVLGDSDTDFVLPGPIPIEWRRRYSSNDERSNGLLGRGWSIPYSVELQILRIGTDEEAIIFVDGQGRKVDLPAIKPGSGLYNTAEQFTVSCTPGGHFEIKTIENLYYQFGELPKDATGNHTLRLKRMQDIHKNWLAFRYDPLGRLINIADSIRRLVRLDYSDTALLASSIHLEHAANGETPATLVRYGYDVEGNLSSVTDRTNCVVRNFTYVDGLMVRQQFADGFACNYQWQSPDAADGPEGARRVVRQWTNDGESYAICYQVSGAGGSTIAVDQLNRRYEWCWDKRYNLTSFTDPLARHWSMRWSDASQLMAVRNPGGDEIQFQYNEHGLLASQATGIGQITRTVWDDRWNQPLNITLPDGGVYRYEYDDRGNNIATVDPTGNTTRYAYDAVGRLVRIVDAKDGRKTLSWNERALLVSYTDCSDKTTRYEYDGYGNTRKLIDAANNTTAFTHDANGRLLAVAQADGANYTYQYDVAGRLVGSTDALSRNTSYDLNLRGRLTERTDAAGRSVGLHYDRAFQLASMTNENGARYQFAYDPADRLVEELRIDGTRNQIEYDANGYPIAITQHPGAGEIENGTEHDPLRTELIRDAVGRLVEKRTATHHYQFRYDAMNRLTDAVKLAVIVQSSVVGGVTPVAADVALKPVHITAFKYDLLGNLIEETATDEITGERHSLSHAHDELGNRTQTVLPQLLGAHAAQRALNYLHYGSGHLHQINLSHTAPGAQGATRTAHQVVADIERDDLHQEIERSQGRLNTRFAHDPVGRKTGSWTQSSSLRGGGAFRTDDAAWQKAISTAHPSPLNGLMKSYNYDLAGELRSAQHTIKGRTEHRYDTTGRIEETVRTRKADASAANDTTSAAVNRNESFGYDPAGNLLDEIAARALSAGSLSTTSGSSRGYVQDNLVRVFEDKRYSYDGFARLIKKRSGKHTEQLFEWDDEHQLTSITTTRRPNTSEAVTQTIRFDYDALGRRVAKQDAFGVTRFIWEGMRLIEERRGESIVTYVYEPGSYVPLARIDVTGDDTDAGGVDTVADAGASALATAFRTSVGAELTEAPKHQTLAANDDAARWDALQPNPTSARRQSHDNARLANVYYFHTDQVGLPEELSDSEGTIRWRASYKTWGSTVSESWEAAELNGETHHATAYARHANAEQYAVESQPLAVEQNLRFQGQYLDRESGLHYNTFRYYDPDIGRFISPDPIGLAGDKNLHLYAPNPVRHIDPLGWDWNYNLTDANGNIYYHGRAADSQSMADVMRRHGNNVGNDGLPRMGAGDTMNRTTPVGTPKDVVRGVENSGTRTNGTLGRGGDSVRGNIDQGISDARLNTKVGADRVAAANAHMQANGATHAGQLPPLESKAFKPKKGC
jgi:RHS repeat-associated protein